MFQTFDYFGYMHMLDHLLDDDQDYDSDDIIYDLKKRLTNSEEFLKKNIFIPK